MSVIKRNGFSKKRQSTNAAAKLVSDFFVMSSVAGARKPAERRPIPFSPNFGLSVNPNLSEAGTFAVALDSVPMVSQRFRMSCKVIPQPLSKIAATGGEP